MPYHRPPAPRGAGHRNRTARLATLALAALALPLALPATAAAHGLAGRQDLPIPKSLFAFAATIVLAASFAGLAVLWREPRMERDEERRVLGVPRVVEILCGLLGIAVFAGLIWAGFAGQQNTAANVVPTFIYVLFWVGIPILSVLFGDVFRPFNPWRALGRAGGWLASRVAGSSLPAPLPYPERIGRWPAVAGLFGFAWLELIYTSGSDPSALAIAALAYAALQLVGMSLYGVEPWTSRGDAFSVYFSFFAALAPLHWRDRTLFARRPVAGVLAIEPAAGTVAFVVLAIGSTAFDGLAEGPVWRPVADDLTSAVQSLGLSIGDATQVAYTTGLLAAALFVWALFQIGLIGMRTVDRSRDIAELARAFVPSLVPIAFAYVLAHYFSLLAFQGQATAYLASDPLGKGWNLIGTADAGVDYTAISANAIWYVQVGTLILGHVAGLVLAHERALTLFREPKKATDSQYWMLAVMVAFTSLGLWLLSASNA